jgi:hypothetical protein
MRPDPLGELRRLFELRKPHYERADHVIDVELLDVEEVIKRVAAIAMRAH